MVQSINQIYAFGKTDTGQKRPLNEDAYYIDTAARCFVVADGVGGASAGEVASGIFTKIVSEVFENDRSVSEQRAISGVKQSFSQANSTIAHSADENPEHNGMACTAELLVVCPDSFVIGHVGDSRTYRFRHNSLVRLTKDHSFVQQQIERGIITVEEARTHRYRNLIIRAVGSDETIDVDIIRGKTKHGDIFMLCSDGLTDMVTEKDIGVTLGCNLSLEDKVSTLINQANQAGGKDNITVILTYID